MAGEKILIVEDDALLQKMYRTVLSNAGYVAMLASDGEEGLALIKKEMPALVMMDVMMPKMNGLQVLDELKADPKLAMIPVIVMTGLSKVNEEKDVKARGASLYLDKSEYDPHRVVKLIEGELQKSKQASAAKPVASAAEVQSATQQQQQTQTNQTTQAQPQSGSRQ